MSKKIESEKSLTKNIEILFKNKETTRSITKKVKNLGTKILNSAKKEILSTIKK